LGSRELSVVIDGEPGCDYAGCIDIASAGDAEMLLELRFHALYHDGDLPFRVVLSRVCAVELDVTVEVECVVFLVVVLLSDDAGARVLFWLPGRVLVDEVVCLVVGEALREDSSHLVGLLVWDLGF
jgi:hypothetical protein